MTADVIDGAKVDIVVFNQLTLRLYVSACGAINLSGATKNAPKQCN